MKKAKFILPISIAPITAPIVTNCTSVFPLSIVVPNQTISYPNQNNAVKVSGNTTKYSNIHLVSSHEDIITSTYDPKNNQFNFYLKNISKTHKKVKLQVFNEDVAISNILNINIEPIALHHQRIFDNIDQIYTDAYVKINGNDTALALFPDDLIIQHPEYMKST
jgi:hypothetical protein